MSDPVPETFIVDCPVCKAKVAAREHGRVRHCGGIDDDGNEHYGVTVHLGVCPKCRSILVGESRQTAIAAYDSDFDEWADAIRVYPKPGKTFTSERIPKLVSDSISEAVKSLQANANVAACVMFGRALEAICRDLLKPAQAANTAAPATASKRPIMLGEGIRQLKDKGLIDQRLFDWSQQLHAFRNVAAHPTDIAISREDADDLCSFVYAIIEYVYDLTDRYNEFKDRLEKRKTK
jgi:hypothetical protein